MFTLILSGMILSVCLTHVIYHYENLFRTKVFTKTETCTSDNIVYCNQLNKIYLEEKLNIIYKKKYNIYISEEKKYKLNKKIDLDNHRINFEKVLKDINQNNHIYYWIINNNFLPYKKLNYIILNLSEVYNYTEKNLTNTINLNYLDEFCHKNKIIFIIIGELYPETFNELKPIFFNKNNYVSPYHYKSKIISTPDRLVGSNYSKKYVLVSINKIMQDIRNREGLTYNNFIYIGKNKLNNTKTIQLK